MSDRRLTAIVFTDIVGYSAIVHRDERLGEQMLDRQRAVVRRLVPLHGGREVETAGDSFLLEFGSALAAMEGVIAIQQTLAAEREPRVVLRASVHLGDVEHRGREVYGDGVNIAARLLPHSPEGGLALSAPVLALVRQRMQLPVRSIGMPTLKNISSPVEIFVVEAAQLCALSPPVPEAAAPAVAAPHGAPASAPLQVSRRVAAMAAGAMAVLLLAVVAASWRLHGPAGAPDGKSVAVLPFVNQSEDKSNAYFADGMQDEILTALSKIKALKVISRTSVEQYRDKPHDIPTIAKALGVAAIMEGGVQRAGNRVRINVQLIDARSDAHVWADTYDRDIADLFAVQSEVARQVASSLQAALLPAESARLAVAPTQDAQAYDLYLQADRFARNVYESPEALVPVQMPKAIALYRQALEHDPKFALASAYVAVSTLNLYWFSAEKPVAWLSDAAAAARKALELQPDLPEGHMAMGLYHYWGHRDYATAEKELGLAHEALPNNDNVIGWLAAVARRQGHWDEAVQYYTQSATLNPQAVGAWRELGNTLLLMRRYADADAAYARAQAVATNPAEVAAYRVDAQLMWTGDVAPLRAALASFTPGSDDFRANVDLFYAERWLSRDYAGALKVLDGVPEPWVQNLTRDFYLPKSLLVAWAQQAKGDAPVARQAFEQARRMVEEALKERPDDGSLHVALSFSYAGLGRHDDAIREGERAVAVMPVSRDTLQGSIILGYLAQIRAAVGDREGALQVLEKVAKVPGTVLTAPGFLKLDPNWDPLRKEPRFQALLGT